MSVYLDHAATTPLRPEAQEAWLRATDATGNAASIHGAGQAARRSLEESRERVAAALDAEPIEVVFTSGGTESINLALTGLWRTNTNRQSGRVVVPEGEHHATVDTAEALAAEGATLDWVPLDNYGTIVRHRWQAALKQDGVVLATALAAANEIGTIQPITDLAHDAAEARVPFHIDAVAAFGHMPLSFRTLRAQSDRQPGSGLVTLSVGAHKVGGPVGIGALLVARDAQIAPILHGGRQQRGLRAGTQDIAAAAAFAVAAELAVAERVAEDERLRGLAHVLIAGVQEALPGVELLGHPHDRLAGNVHFLFPGAAGETLLFLLDQHGIWVSTGSACQAGVAEPSHVVRALRRDAVAASSVLRFTLGRTTTAADVTEVLRVLPGEYRRAVAAGAPTPIRS